MKARLCQPRRFCLLALSLLLGGGNATAALVEDTRVRGVAATWLSITSSPLSAGLAADILTVEGRRAADGLLLYYEVRLKPAGFVIVAADDRLEPIIAFSESAALDQHPCCPLRALLESDMRFRRDRANRPGRGAAALAARRKWQVLSEPTGAGELGVTGSGVGTVDDLRIAPLIQSRWNQRNIWDGAASVACYNYYTPPGPAGSAANMWCGCANTATAQILRHFRYPVDGPGVYSNEISYVVGETLYDQWRTLLGGDGAGGPYDWDSMPLVPYGQATLEERRAIGALCHDAGIVNGTHYTESGSSASLSVNALQSVFMFSHAVCGGLSFFPDAVNANLDARLPVYMSVSGDGGHAIVCDGYGYSLSTIYHHLNMGWGGTQDAWYALPDVDTDWYQFTAVSGFIYNIYTNGSGEIVSGRIVDIDGRPITNCLVTLTSAGTTNAMRTDAAGIYAFTHLPSNDAYLVVPSHPGYVFLHRPVAIGTSVPYAETGNRWGMDCEGTTNAAAAFVSGRVVAPDGRGYPGVEVQIEGVKTVTTDRLGFFYAVVPLGWVGTVTPGREGHVFTPAMQRVQATAVRVSCDPFTTVRRVFVDGDAAAGGTGLSWAEAMTNLAAALDEAEAWTEVWVAEGAYRPGPERAQSFYVSGNVSVYGGFAGTEASLDERDVNGHTTVLDGDIGVIGVATDNVYHVVQGDGNACVDGFTIRHGYADGESFADLRAGGVYFSSNTSTVRQCRIEHCFAEGGGGAGRYGTFVNSVLASNTAREGGAVCNGTIIRCQVRDNVATNGGGLAFGVAYDCLITDNTGTSYGGGAYQSTLVHCTVVSNTAVGYGGASMWCFLTNCIAYYNSAGYSPNCYLSGGYRCDYSCTTPLPAAFHGVGTITTEPRFVDGAVGWLSSESPCIDAGTNGPSTVDFNGMPRPLDGDADGVCRPDMGCHEFLNAAADSDGDGVCDGQEMDAGTHPGDASDYLHMLMPVDTSAEGVEIRWSSKAGQSYTVVAASNMGVGFPLVLATNIPGTPPENVLTNIPAAGTRRRFYRVMAE